MEGRELPVLLVDAPVIAVVFSERYHKRLRTH